MKTHSLKFLIEENAIKDGGDGRIMFNKPVAITDNSEQWNGTKYDMETYDISNYKGKLTANHSGDIEDIIGNVFGLQKVGNKVTIDGVQFAINENPLALFAYNMMLGGYLTDFSTETIGPWPAEDGIYKDAKLVGLSAVVTGNNKKAHVNEVNQIAVNSMRQAESNGMDVSLFKNWGIDTNKVISNTIEEVKNDNDMKFKKVINNRDFAVTVSYKNTAGEDAQLTLNAGQAFEVLEEQAVAVEDQVKNAVAPSKKDENKEENSTDAITAAINAAINPLIEKVDKLEKETFNKNATEPQFKNGYRVNVNTSSSKYADMGYKQRHGKQINLAWDMLKGHSAAAGDELREINQVNLEALQKENIVENTLSLTDFGNFVISPELLKDIEGFRSNFQPLLGKINFQETLSLQMAWLKRNGDVDMQEVSLDPDADGANTSLKPITEYAATFHTSNLKEVAAVTPVCDSTTRFLAADLLGDVTAGYRLDYDRKKAQLFIARLQQAINETGNNTAYDRTSAVTGLVSWAKTFAKLTEIVGEGGLFIFNYKTKSQLIQDAIQAGISGPLATMLMSGDLKPILGQDYIVVPNELMPTLNTAETKSFTVEGTTVTVNKAVFYLDPMTFAGRVSGGLNFDLSAEAAYEQNGTVKSAYQRNEIVLRGSFFRGGAVKDTSRVSAMGAQGIS